VFSAPIALALYATAFEAVGRKGGHPAAGRLTVSAGGRAREGHPPLAALVEFVPLHRPPNRPAPWTSWRALPATTGLTFTGCRATAAP
jgi:hypothetical protein